MIVKVQIGGYNNHPSIKDSAPGDGKVSGYRGYISVAWMVAGRGALGK